MTDDLRARIADALRERMALVCRPGGQLATGELVQYIGATEHDLADAVLAVVQPPDDELTREEAVALSDDLGQQLYRAQDRVAFVREMLTGRTGTVDVADVLAWLDHQHCPRIESEQQQIARLTALADARHRVIERMARESLHADAAVQRVRDLHTPDGVPDPNGAAYCSSCHEQMPCPTLKALDRPDSMRRTTPDNPLTSTNTVDLSGHDVRCPSCRKLLGQFIKTEAEVRVLIADHTC